MPVRHAQQATGDRSVGTLDANHLRLAQSRCVPTSRAVDALSITPPGGATDSIRCAMPTCSPTRCNRNRTDLTGDHLTRVQAHP